MVGIEILLAKTSKNIPEEKIRIEIASVLTKFVKLFPIYRCYCLITRRYRLIYVKSDYFDAQSVSFIYPYGVRTNSDQVFFDPSSWPLPAQRLEYRTDLVLEHFFR